MKHTLYALVYFSFITNAFGQSVTLQPNFFQLPRLAANPACTVPDKGKMIFNTNLNKILYCNGTVWIEPESGLPARITPAFNVIKSAGQVITTTLEKISFTSEDLDLSNTFTLNNEAPNPNTFTAPDDGVYEFNVNAELDYTNFTPLSSTKVRIGFGKSFENGGSFWYTTFSLRDYTEEDYFHVSKLLKMKAGDRVHVSISVVSPPDSGTLEIAEIYFSGHLISWY